MCWLKQLQGQSSGSFSKAVPSVRVDTGERDLEKGLVEQGTSVGLEGGQTVQGGGSSIFRGWGTTEKEEENSFGVGERLGRQRTCKTCEEEAETEQRGRRRGGEQAGEGGGPSAQHAP